MQDVKGDKIFLSIIIPAYNEEKKIAKDLACINDYVSKQFYDYEVIVVDDGSKDKTHEIVKALEAQYHNLRCIHYDQNQGKGYAVKTGILQARGEHILFVDSGNCVPYKDLEKGLQLLQADFDIAVGSRALDESKIIKRQPKYRRIGAKVFGFIVHFIMGAKLIKDTQCGFKVFKRKASQDIFSKNQIDGFMFDLETIINAEKMGFKIKEFPVSWRNDPDTKFNPFWGSIRNLWELFLIKFQK